MLKAIAFVLMVKAATLVLAVVVVAPFVWANWPAQSIDESVEADLVVVKKSERVLELYAKNKLIRSYRVSLGHNPEGPKRVEGDHKTPEGTYVIDYRKANSSFHRALHISYPSAADAARAHANLDDPGGLIMIHGLPNGRGYLGKLHRFVDWTDGCVAVTDAEIEQIWSVVDDGTRIRIEP